MKPARGFVQIIIVTTVALALGVVGILGYQKYYKKSPASVQKTETTSSSNQISDETANWKTYINQDFSYLIKYPPTIQVKKENVEQDLGIEYGFQGEVVDILALELIPNSTSDIDRIKAMDFSMQIWVVSGINNDIKSYAKTFMNKTYGDHTTTEPINLNGSAGYKISVPIVYTTNTLLPTKNPGTIIVISERRRVSDKTEEYLKLYNQSLSTFQFLD